MNIKNKAVGLMLSLCLSFGFVEGMQTECQSGNFSQGPTQEVKIPRRAPTHTAPMYRQEKKSNPNENIMSKKALLDKYKDRLEKTVVYILATEWNQIDFVDNLKQTMGMSIAELEQAGVEVHFLLVCDGILKDYEVYDRAFKDFPHPHNVDKQEENEGCSQTRYNQLETAHKLMKKDIERGFTPYFFVFDSDDIIHKDLILLELLTQFETGADSVGPGERLRCHKEDSSAIFDYASEDIEDFSIVSYYFEEFAFNLYPFSALDWLMNNKHRINSHIDLITLDLLGNPHVLDGSANTSKNVSVYLDGSIRDSIPSPFDAPFFKDVENKNKKVLFYYMQHGASLEHSPLVETSQIFGHGLDEKIFEDIKKARDNKRSIDSEIEFQKEILFLFGDPKNLTSKLKVTSQNNTAVDREFLLKKWKNAHITANSIFERFKEIESPEEFPLYQWLCSEKSQRLLEQDQTTPLAREFMEDFYGEVLNTIFEEAEKK